MNAVSSSRQLPARIRAAIAYSGHNNREVAKQLNVSVSTLERWRGGSEVGGRPTEDQLLTLARYCGVPYTFILNGFPQANADDGIAAGSVAEQIRQLNQALRLGEKDRDLLSGELEALSETVEKRFGELAAQMLRLEQRLAPGGSRSRP